jgi:hypothetical protein
LRKIKRKTYRIVPIAVIVVIILVAIAMFALTAPPTPQASVPEDLPPEGVPPSILVIPEAPLGTLAITVACFFALVISQIRHKTKLQ